jgi:hypothetical protein
MTLRLGLCLETEEGFLTESRASSNIWSMPPAGAAFPSRAKQRGSYLAAPARFMFRLRSKRKTINPTSPSVGKKAIPMASPRR